MAVAIALACVAAETAAAKPGRLVPGFGAGGIARLDAPALGNSTHTAVAADPAGRIVVLAAGETGGEILRQLPDGAADDSFGRAGRIALAGGPWGDVGVDAAGRIVVAGSVGRDLAIARFAPSGAPDPTFSGDGVATLHLDPPPPSGTATPTLFEEEFTRIELEADGSVVALGEIRACFQDLTSCYPQANVVARFGADGAPDRRFGDGGGASILDLRTLFGLRGEAGAGFGALALQPDGRVLLGGSSGYELTLLRLTATGALDGEFAGDGVFTSRIDTLDEPEGIVAGNAKAVLARPDGRIVAVGEGHLVGVRPDGQLDRSFGDRGSAPVSPPAFIYANVSPEAAMLDSAGRILVAGRDAYSSVLLRYFPGGRPDPRFARGGHAGLDLTRVDFQDAEAQTPAELLTDVALLGDGDLLAAGFFKPRRRSPRIRPALVRYDGSDGRLAYCHGRLAVLQGTPGDDRLNASGPIVAFGGDDLIVGSRGRICAGAGDDVLEGIGGGPIYGGPGDDRVLVNFGPSTVLGGAGDDTLRTVPNEGARMDLAGGSGADLLVGGDSRDRLRGGGGADRLFGAAGRDRLFGGPGADLLAGAGGTDRLLGGSGVDRLLPGPDGPPQVVYRDERPLLTISLVLRPGHVSGIHLSVQMPCRNGEVLYSSSSYDQHHIPLRADGSFAYRESRGWDSEHLRGRLEGDRIVGTYEAAHGMGRGRCQTGRPSDPVLHFVARR